MADRRPRLHSFDVNSVSHIYSHHLPRRIAGKLAVGSAWNLQIGVRTFVVVEAPLVLVPTIFDLVPFFALDQSTR